MSELKVGDIIRDNDPCLTRERRLVVVGVGDDYVEAKEAKEGRLTYIGSNRIYTDDKPRRSGFSVVRS